MICWGAAIIGRIGDRYLDWGKMPLANQKPPLFLWLSPSISSDLTKLHSFVNIFSIIKSILNVHAKLTRKWSQSLKFPSNCLLSWDQGSAVISEVSSKLMKSKPWINPTAAIRENSNIKYSQREQWWIKIHTHVFVSSICTYLYNLCLFASFVWVVLLLMCCLEMMISTEAWMTYNRLHTKNRF